MAVSPDGTAYELSGNEAAPVVVLIHGLGLTRATWRDHVPALSRHFRVLAYDLLGHGESAVPQETPSLTSLAAQLRDLLDHLAIERAALVGFSLGGMINRRFTMDHPARVTALVIQNAPHARGAALQAKVEAQARDAKDGGPEATIEAALQRWFTPAFQQSTPETVDWVRRTVLANNPANYAAHRLVLAAGVTELIRPDPPISHPTLVMTCQNDSGSTPAMSHAIAGEISGSEGIIIPELRHLGLLEAPLAFTVPVIEFLLRTL